MKVEVAYHLAHAISSTTFGHNTLELWPQGRGFGGGKWRFRDLKGRPPCRLCKGQQALQVYRSLEYSRQNKRTGLI